MEANYAIQDMRNNRLALMDLGFETSFYVLEWKTYMISHLDYDCPIGKQFGPPEGINAESTRIENANKYLSMINYLFSDVIVIWRVWVMSEHNMKLVSFLALLSLGCAVASLISINHLSRLYVFLIVAYSTTLATNLISTIFMAVKSWQHRRLIKTYLGDVCTKSQTGSILALLIETGSMYCLMYMRQISFFVVAVWSGFWENYTGNILVLGGMVQISGSYPTAVIALAAFQKTAWDMSIGMASRNVSERHVAPRHTRAASSTIQIGYYQHTSALDGRLKEDSAPADLAENV
ncbi:hypothetical protein HETIRDRAFT_426200 [Heterobasidion irregulare TC 32-1]|uniref:Uncharacterized protein n=1 Tax=Heterobasidion irregulare (strain TC 32-1) TaxID=747525 RepID=W4KBX0_HETIT|nr:uncharacterized protein HETIRDRAFT_426200 [Heterobasidion irregulare TC 32-1]ETW82576.1 hypothetical protein HETIRDRAFT_426200 [Heterobasidion irregulare TC 32-1]